MRALGCHSRIPRTSNAGKPAWPAWPISRRAHWLADPGTGSYVTRDLFWYRSTLAHDAPLLDGRTQEAGKSRCVAFDDHGEWAWIRGEWDGVTRTIVTGPDWLADLVEYAGPSA